MENGFDYSAELFGQAALSLEKQGYFLTAFGVGILWDAVAFWTEHTVMPVTYGEFWKNLDNLENFMIDEILYGEGV